LLRSVPQKKKKKKKDVRAAALIQLKKYDVVRRGNLISRNDGTRLPHSILRNASRIARERQKSRQVAEKEEEEEEEEGRNKN